MNQFITVESSKGTVSLINIAHIIRLKQTDKGAIIYLTDGTQIYPAQTYDEVVEVLEYCITPKK